MSNHPDLTEAFEQAIDNYGYSGGDLDRIETRACGSDNYDGVEYDFYGRWIPVRAVIDVVAEAEHQHIESMSLIDESTDENGQEPPLGVFVADLRPHSPEHPAFTNVR